MEKNKSEFPKLKLGRDGLSPRCVLCKRTYERERCKNNPDRREQQRQSQRRKSEKHNLTPLRKFSTYKHSAKEKGREFSITREQFMELWQKPCYYCAAPIKTIGIDRVNNENGYTAENIVSCCSLCNYAKRGLSKSEFVALCLGVVETHQKREAGKALPENHKSTPLGGSSGS